MTDLPSQLADRRSEERRRGRKRFDRWRRNVYIAFAALALANAGAIAWVYDTRGEVRQENTERQGDVEDLLIQVQQGRENTLLKICAIDNAQNAAVRRILDRFDIDSSSFKSISCSNLIQDANTRERP